MTARQMALLSVAFQAARDKHTDEHTACHLLPPPALLLLLLPLLLLHRSCTAAVWAARGGSSTHASLIGLVPQAWRGIACTTLLGRQQTPSWQYKLEMVPMGAAAKLVEYRWMEAVSHEERELLRWVPGLASAPVITEPPLLPSL